MTNLKLKSTLAAVAMVCAFAAAPAQAGAPNVSRNSGVGKEIAAQGNAALTLIRAELKAAMMKAKPVLPAPARPRPVSATVPGAAGSLASTARCAE